ncbi:MAG TPA: GAF domain-containing sensor histidine kinase [Longimicrobiales bacterium]|nr:GAF domain-containing sensor histidine kinase [Longimicrobiales bacterium]
MSEPAPDEAAPDTAAAEADATEADAGASRASPAPPSEMEIASELAHAFLTASNPLEVYRLALSRVTPLVGAQFSSVFLRDPADRDLLKLSCAHNWPQSAAMFLGQLRVRVGRGPTGKAVAELGAVEVPDVFADPALREWWEPARELGFTSMICLPLEVGGAAEGALSFYFAEAHEFNADERRLLSLIATQLAATAEKAHLIEDLRSANRALRHQNEELGRKVRDANTSRQLKNEFLANISHELRTPLTAILGYTYLLKSASAGEMNEKQLAAVGKIDRSAGILLRLIGDLLELSQLKLGRVPVNLRVVDAGDIARKALEAVEADDQAVPFRYEHPEGPLPLQTDGDKAQKVLENLLSNAFKFTLDGSVTLTLRVTEDRAAALGGGAEADIRPAPSRWVEWEVADTGIGIPPEKLNTIFDEFRQVDGSSTRLYGGTGLGLALCLRIARLLNGEVTVDSQQGEGSRFTLRLPIEGSPLPYRDAVDPPPGIPTRETSGPGSGLAQPAVANAPSVPPPGPPGSREMRAQE